MALSNSLQCCLASGHSPIFKMMSFKPIDPSGNGELKCSNYRDPAHFMNYTLLAAGEGLRLKIIT